VAEFGWFFSPRNGSAFTHSRLHVERPSQVESHGSAPWTGVPNHLVQDVAPFLGRSRFPLCFRSGCELQDPLGVIDRRAVFAGRGSRNRLLDPLALAAAALAVVLLRLGDVDVEQARRAGVCTAVKPESTSAAARASGSASVARTVGTPWARAMRAGG
jgi:hypothetical protein